MLDQTATIGRHDAAAAQAGVSSPRLTVVLPMKGRGLFTLRYLSHANKVRMPYRFLIADGQVNEPVAHYLERGREEFPNLDIDYVRYPDDDSYRRYFVKLSDAVSRVRTPYVMLTDNDDFIGVDGTERALDYLDAHPDTVCASGRIAAFSVYSGPGGADGNIHGRLNGLGMSYAARDYSAPKVAERLRDGGLGLGLYYATYRTEALTTILRESVEIDFSDLMLYETFHCLRAVTLGKVHVDPSVVSYYRQLGTSITYRPSQDWVAHLLRSRFTVDAEALVDRLARATAAADGTDAAAAAAVIRPIIEDYFRVFLAGEYGWRTRVVRLLRARLPRLTRWLQSRPRFFIGRQRSALLASLAAAGASPQSQRRTRSELADIEQAFSHDAFAEYAAPFRDVAVSDDRRNWL